MSNILRYAGFKEENEFNESNKGSISPMPGEGPEADFHVDIASSDLDIAASKNTTVPSGIGKGAKQKVQTFNYPEGSIEYACDINTIGFFMKMALGEYRFKTFDTGKTVHEFFGDSSSVPRSFIATVGKDKFEHLFTGCVVESMEISVSDSVVTANVSIVGANVQRREIKLESDLNIPDNYPLAFHRVSVNISETGMNGSINEKVQDLTISISNNPSTDQGKTLGSLHPTRIITGDREVTVSYTLYFENEDELVRYEDDEEFKLMIKFFDSEGNSMEVVLPRAYYDSVPTTVSGLDAITQSASVNTLVGDIELVTPIEDSSETTTAEIVETNIYVSLFNQNEEGY